MTTNQQWLASGSVAMCEICFAQLTPAQCALDIGGSRWDICKGDCARDAGITEAPKDWLVGAPATH